jgi:hypothetical protein
MPASKLHCCALKTAPQPKFKLLQASTAPNLLLAEGPEKTSTVQPLVLKQQND